ncbi:unnamed protein product [Parajaminaea phylloscopi]
MSFAPVQQIHQVVHAYHVPSHDRTQSVEAYHYCSHRGDMKQCLIYDSDSADAKLIGIEYLVTEEKFRALPEDEKPYWHSHKHEVSSGLLCALNVAGPAGIAGKAATALPGVAPHGGMPDELEKGPLMQIYKMYGKTIHTWHPTSSDVPLGPPVLMFSTTPDHPAARADAALLAKRKEKMGIDTDGKEKVRQAYLDLDYQTAEGSDDWEKTGLARVFKTVEEPWVDEHGQKSRHA